MTPDDIEALYDAHAPLLYALALRMTGDAAAAAAALESAFLGLWEMADAAAGSELRTLVRLTRDRALERKQVQTAVSPVDSRRATAAGLVEEAFFGGVSLSGLGGKDGLGGNRGRRAERDGKGVGRGLGRGKRE